MEFSAQYIAECINGEVIGDPSIKITSVARIESGKAGNLVFLGNLKYEEYLYTSKASVVILNKCFEPSSPLEMTVIKVDDAYMAIASVLELFNSAKSASKRGISLLSHISFFSRKGKGCYIGVGTVVEKRAKIGDRVQIYPQCYIGEEVEIGDRTILYPGVKIYRGCKIGSDCIIHANAVIGADGFGFVPLPDGTFKKIPQTGNVVIEDLCEIGANTTIDRASIGSTIIRRGVKIDNLVQVAHNTEIGENTVIAAQAGISGSTKIGKNCMLGGQAGLSGHISIADKTMIGAQAGVISTIKDEGRSIIGSPAIDAKEYFKAYAIFRKLHKR
ncbi:MAG: UDP-3-O-(3-hydroxymyristoyl)glucosamine N-acyltransferase [Bacteroidales bacterium]